MVFTDVVRPFPASSPSPAPSSPSPSKPTLAAIVPGTPSRKEPRRRSWFGLVTPTRSSKDRATVSAAGAAVPPAPTGAGAPPPQHAHNASAGSHPVSHDDNSMEELEVTPQPRRSAEDNSRTRRPWAVSSLGRRSGARSRSQSGYNTDSDRESEVMMLAESDNDSDWETTGTVRRRRTLRRSGSTDKVLPPPLLQLQPQALAADDPDATPVRQKDLATLAILSRSNTAKPKQPFKSRIFSRTANDSDPPPPPSETTTPASGHPPLAASITPSNLPQRISSIARGRPMNNSGTLPPVNIPPPLSVETSPVGKPLPLLPARHDSLPLRAASVPSFAAASNENGPRHEEESVPSSPIPPTDIVVTPSSPLHKTDLFLDPFTTSHVPPPPLPPPPPPTVDRPISCPPDSPKQRMLPRIAHRTQSPAPSPTFRSKAPTPLGLGLPEGHPRRGGGSGAMAIPAAVSVSSPLPRSPTPATKVSFSTKEGHDYETKDPSEKVKAPRPRSFSAMFSRSPLLNLDATTDDDESGSSSKFNWLGVRKTIKRRRSESKLNQRKSLLPMPFGGSGSEPSTDHFGGKPTNVSSPMLISQPRLQGSSTGMTAQYAPGEISTPSTLSLFVLPPVEQEEWWPAREWSDKPDAEDKPGAEDKEEIDTDSRDSIASSGSVRRGPVSRGSSLLATSHPSLGSLPEGGLAPSATPSVPPIEEQAASPPPQKLPPRRDPNRRRSYSDAGRRSFRPPLDSPASQSPTQSPRNFLAALTGETAPWSPKPVRPSSSNSTLVKMRNVFTISGRSRSNSALRYGLADERDHDGRDGRDTPFNRPASSASVGSSYVVPSPALLPVRIRPEDVPQVSQLQLMVGAEDDRHVVLSGTPPERSPRSSYTASLGSRSQSGMRRSHTADPHAPGYGHGPALHPGRARASTISSGVTWGSHGMMTHSNHSTTATFGHGPPPGGSVSSAGFPNYSIHGALSPSGSAAHLPLPAPTFPTAATPPRRPGSIRRLSTGLFRAGASSPKPPSLIRSGSEPVMLDDFIPRDSSHSQSRSGSVIGIAHGMGPVRTVADKGLDKKDVDTTVHDDDTSETWLKRVLPISRRQLSSVLAESSDKFHMDALAMYMSRFDFHHTALDVALRRLLMDLSLPKETQQIDRVIETFASRYETCEPALFGSKDNTYVLAFSMMMLHTDAFNRHNKNKMTKADYVRNTRLDGVPETTLEAFYDNITFTPFVFIEDDNEASLAAIGASTTANGSVRPGKVDVYDMIAGGTVMTLRANVETLIPPESPFSCMGTRAFLDVDSLQRQFANAHPLSFVKPQPRRKSSVVSLPASGSHPGSQPTIKSVPKEEIQTLKITKVGLVMRKDDSLTATGKRPSGRKWKNWSVILTGSQLLFFKDTILALTLVEQIRNGGRHDSSGIPRMTRFQPDEVMSVKECVAVWDREYTEMPFTFRFIMPEGRQYLMQALDENEMNEWLTLINYASTFKSAGIRMRAGAIDSGEAVMAGTVAAESHRKDLANGGVSPYGDTPPGSTRAVLFSDTTTGNNPSASPPVSTLSNRPMLRRMGSLRATPTPMVDITGANDVVVGGGEQIEAVIGSVKAELAGRGGSGPLSPSAVRHMSMVPMPDRSQSAPPFQPSLRAKAIQERLRALRDAAGVIEKRLTANLRVGRNLALLTPFQKITRDRIEAAVPELADRIRNDRIDLAKLHLWISMLLKDQERDEREWARVRLVALQAAAKSLRTGGTGTSVMERRATLAHPIAIPKLSLPPHGDDDDDDSGLRAWTPDPTIMTETPGLILPDSLMSPPPLLGSGASTGSVGASSSDLAAVPGSATTEDTGSARSEEQLPTPESSKRDSSASGHSDYELASEYLSAESVLDLHEELVQRLGADAPPRTSATSSRSVSGADSPAVATVARRSLGFVTPPPGSESTGNSPGPGPGTAGEQAEHWQNTRAATRVSLARLPRAVGELQSRIDNWI